MTLPAKLYGLVLAGGKSTRMGTDKGLLEYHGKPQRAYLFELLKSFCEATYFSVRKDQGRNLPDGGPCVLDQDRYRGPFNGLRSAHAEYPDVAWLVLACDLPLLDSNALRELVSARDLERTATAFALKENPLPEPLCAIWEPKGLDEAERYLEAGHGTFPRKFLIRHDTKLVFPNDPNVLLNANSETDYERALELMATS